MSNYIGMKCPVCGQTFTESCDVVVCPDCGLPHHRACWKELGHCAHPELHASAEAEAAAPDMPETAAPTQPEAPAAAEPETEAEALSKLCPFCHAENNSDASFCHSCGAPLTAPADAPQGTPFQVLYDPLGGVKPEEDIDGASAGDLARVVGENSSYYLPRFAALSKSKKVISLNFTALLFELPWLLSRKIYIPAIGVLITKLALSIPTIWGFIATQQAGGVEQNFSNSFWLLYNVCNVLQVVLQLAVGFFGNRLYKDHCVALAQKLRDRCPDDDAFRAAARKKGGISKFFLFLTGTLTFLYFMFTMFLNMAQ